MYTSNPSTAERRICRMARTAKINCSEKTFKNFKNILKVYSTTKVDLKVIHYDIPKEEINKIAPELYAAMIADEVIPLDTVGELIEDLFSRGDVSKRIEQTLEDIRNFQKEGKFYYPILKGLYFEDPPRSDKEIQITLKLSRSHYFRKKKNAIFLFGVIFWNSIRLEWENSDAIMQNIDEATGRDRSSFFDS